MTAQDDYYATESADTAMRVRMLLGVLATGLAVTAAIITRQGDDLGSDAKKQAATLGSAVVASKGAVDALKSEIATEERLKTLTNNIEAFEKEINGRMAELRLELQEHAKILNHNIPSSTPKNTDTTIPPVRPDEVIQDK